MLAFIPILGIIIMTLCAIPQIARLLKRKSSEDVSLLWLGLLLLGLILIQVEAVRIKSIIFITSGSLSISLTVVILFLSFKYRTRGDKYDK